MPPRRFCCRTLNCTFAAFVISFGHNLLADTRVAVRTEAEFSYASQRAQHSPPQPESYVYYPGKFFPGHVRDGTLERMTFTEIAQILAPYLRKQHYVPASELAEADLVLVVHWGVTMGHDRAAALFTFSLDNQARLQEAESAITTIEAEIEEGRRPLLGLDPELHSWRLQAEDLHTALSARQSSEFGQLQRDLTAGSNSTLLGIGDLLHRENKTPFGSSRKVTLNAMLDEDRYFVVVMAYDRRLLMEEGTAKRLWTARISIRAPGVNFRQALHRLGVAGGNYFGRSTDGMEIRRVRSREVEVFIGEATVIAESP